MAFISFLDQFSNSPIAPAYTSYLSLSIGATSPELPSPVQLYWPTQTPYETTPFSQNIQIVTNDSSSNIIVLPDATLASINQTTVIINTSGTDINLENFTGTTIGVIADSGSPIVNSYYITLTDNTTQGGVWLFAAFGTAASPPFVTSLIDAQTNTLSTNYFYPDQLMQGGLAVVNDTQVAIPGNYLKTNMIVQSFPGLADYNQSQGDRGTLLVWEVDGGTFSYNLMSAYDAGNGFIFSIKNDSASGNINMTVLLGSGDSVDITQMTPGTSASFISNGLASPDGAWTSLGYGLNTIPSTFTNVQVVLAQGSQGTPPLRFLANPSAGLYYDTIDVPAEPSLQIVQNGFVLGQFQQDSITYTTGLSTFLGSQFQNSLVNLVVNGSSFSAIFTPTTATLQTNSIFTDSSTTLFDSSFTTALVELIATNITLTATDAVNLVGDTAVSITSTTGSVALTSDTTMTISATTSVTMSAVDAITISSSANSVELEGNTTASITAPQTLITSSTSVDMDTPSIQQYETSIYSIMRAYS